MVSLFCAKSIYIHINSHKERREINMCDFSKVKEGDLLSVKQRENSQMNFRSLLRY